MTEDVVLPLLEAVTEERETATAIWRRMTDTPAHKSLTTRMRRERREAAARLEELAFEGLICRDEGDAGGHPVPVYFRSDAYDASFPSRATLERRAKQLHAGE